MLPIIHTHSRAYIRTHAACTCTHTHTHTCMPNSRLSWPSCPQMRSSCWWPCTFTKHTTQPHNHTHACTPESRRSRPGCPLLHSFYQWPCTFTKHTIQTHTYMLTQFQEVMARLPADESFMLVALHIYQTYHTNTQSHTCMHARPIPGNHGPAARCCVLPACGLAHSPNIPYKHTRMHAQSQEVMARLLADEIFMLVALHIY